MKTKSLLPLLLFCLMVGCKQAASSFDTFVDTRIGNANGGRTFRGAVKPWGMASFAPYFVDAAKGVDTALVGFGIVNLSGVGCGDLSGAVLLMPYNGNTETPVESVVSNFSNEITTAGVYACTLDAYDIDVKATATTRSVISNYKFKDKNRENIINIDLTKHLNSKFKESTMKQISPTEVVGRKSQGSFCSASPDIGDIYFYVKFSEPILSHRFWSLEGDEQENEITGLNVGGSFSFGNVPEVDARVGISYVSIDNARLNLETEQAGRSYEKLESETVKTWNDVLGKIEIETPDKEDKVIFYTALYHCLIHPNVFSDVNGEYRTMGKHEIRKAEGYTRYTLYSLWDSYRNVHSLVATFFPDVQKDMVTTMLEMYRENGWLPKWEHMGFETFNMNGSPATPVIVDSYMKGIPFDTELAYEAITRDALADDSKSNERVRPGLEAYRAHGGFIPHDLTGEREFLEWRENPEKPRPAPPVWGPVSTTIEYNYSDWCISQFAKALGKTAAADSFMEISLGYRNYYNPEKQFLLPKNSDGSWVEPYDPLAELWFGSYPAYVEGNAWHYLFAAPHDIEGMKSLMGGEAAYAKRLNECFDQKQYVLVNEPDMFYPYLFTHIKGEEYKTQQLVHDYIRAQYNTGVGGIPGNDDAGALSAFALYGMLGFYPINPTTNNYELSSPMVDKATLHLPGGKTFVIERNMKDSLVAPVLNGKPLDRFYLTHDELMNGGVLTFSEYD
ncbi:MAG: GH92 family glycosyl hydrolase [Bacteroidales bacterium]|nr:GH92 family glycosyl hydrolase [Bacteroidales bacterium]